MASSDVDVRKCDGDEMSNCSESITKKFFKCCSRPCKVLVCKNCDTFYHEGCVKRMKNIIYKSDTVIICCQQDETNVDEKEDVNIHETWVSDAKISKLEMENLYLKQLIHEIQDKNSILHQNNFLLSEKINDMKSKLNLGTGAPPIAPVGKHHIQVNTTVPDDCRNLRMMKKPSTVTNELPQVRIEPPLSNESTSRTMSTSDKTVSQNIDKTSNLKKRVQQQQINNRRLRLRSFNSATSEEVCEVNIMNKTKMDQDGDWKKVEYRRKKNIPRFQRPQPIKGVIETTNSLAAKQLSCLFITGLKPNTNPEELKKYIKEIFKIEIKCEAMKTRKDSYKSSFKLYVPIESKETIMDPSKWEKGISLNHFLHIRRYLNEN